MAWKDKFPTFESQAYMLENFIEICQYGSYTECMHIVDDLYRSVGHNPGEITEFLMYMEDGKIQIRTDFRSSPQNDWLAIDGNVITNSSRKLITQSIKNIPKDFLMDPKIRLMPLILAFNNNLALLASDVIMANKNNTYKIQRGLYVTNVKFYGNWSTDEIRTPPEPTPESITIPSVETMRKETIDLFREKLDPLFKNKEMVRKGCVKIDITDEPLYVLYWVENTYKTLGYRYSYDPSGKILSITW